MTLFEYTVGISVCVLLYFCFIMLVYISAIEKDQKEVLEDILQAIKEK
jgi:hypothetical protein